MNPTENDMQLLEAHLDGELSGEDAAALERRLELDQALADALDESRSARMTREAVWRSLHPTPAQVEGLVAAVGSACRRDAIWRKRATALRWVSAAAASVVVGIGVGWLTRGPAGAVSDNSGLGPVAIHQPIGNLTSVSGFSPADSREMTLPVARHLIAAGSPARPALGVGVVPVVVEGDRAGLRVEQVLAGSVAAQAGLRVGDVIVGLSGKAVVDVGQFAGSLAECEGKTPLIIVRDGARETITVDLRRPRVSD